MTHPALARFAAEGGTAASVLTLMDLLRGSSPGEAMKEGLRGGLAWGTIGATWPGFSRLAARGVGKVRTYVGRRKRADDKPSVGRSLTAPGRMLGQYLGARGGAEQFVEGIKGLSLGNVTSVPGTLLGRLAGPGGSYIPPRSTGATQRARGSLQRAAKQKALSPEPKAPQYAANVPRRPLSPEDRKALLKRRAQDLEIKKLELEFEYARRGVDPPKQNSTHLLLRRLRERNR